MLFFSDTKPAACFDIGLPNTGCILLGFSSLDTQSC